MLMYRQGDVLLVKANDMDLAEAKKRKAKKGRVVLALGEVTGHSHTMTAEKSSLYDLFDREVLVVEEADALTHQEHARIEVDPGTYWVVHQVEYTPATIVRVDD